MTADDLETLVDFHYWATRRVLDAAAALTPGQLLQDLGNSFPSVRDTLAHLYGADWIWCARWNGESPSALPDPRRFPDVASLREAWDAHEPEVRAVLARFSAGVDQPVEYERLGVRQAQPFAQTLQHLVNHGTYHRGQVVTLLRQLGVEAPPSTDLIAFFRERQGIAA